MIENSNRVLASINGEAIGFSKSASLSVSNQLMIVTKSATNGWVERISAVKGASINFDGLVDSDISNVNSIFNHLQLGSKITFRFGSLTGGRLNGSGFVESLELGGGTDDAPSFSGSIGITEEVASVIVSQLVTLQINGENVTINGTTLQVALQT